MSIHRKAALAVGIVSLFVSAITNAEASAAFAFGPVERQSPRTVTVLGQTYSLNRTTSSLQLETGTLVLVEGGTDRTGAKVARTIKLAKAPYVAGATDVALSGVVSRFDAKTGVLTIGDLSVYFLDAPVANASALAVGSEVEIIGRQAAPFAPLWASEIRFVSPETGGTGKGVQSIEGTGRLTQSIEGTGKSVQSIEGTGRLTQSIEGTGKSVQSIEGTGRLAQSIEGTGKSVQSIEGTGRLAQSIEGTGKSVQSIEGTGRLTQSIEGTGKSAQSIEGTGRAQSIEGTGITAQ